MGSVTVGALIFWLCAALIAWEVALFPAVLWALGRLRPRPLITSENTPTVSVIIAARNEARHIAAKLDNTLALDYPPECLEIIVISDASDDDTDRLILACTDPRVHLLRQEPRRGKTAAQNLAALSATGEVLLFTDATALYEPSALRRLVRRFADESIACVTGKVALPATAAAPEAITAAALKARWRYEEGIRGRQGDAFSLFGATGCIYAVRRSRYRPVPDDQVSDLVLPLMLLAEGHRTVFAPDAVATLHRPISAGRELHRRSRVILQCLRAMWHMRVLLMPWRCGLLLAAIAWYRLLRWLLPIVLIAVLLSNLAALVGAPHSAVYWWALAGQAIFYGLALLGAVLEVVHLRAPLVAVPFFFVWLNVAAGVALARLARGEKAIVWDTVRS